jgi:glycosyltransferase involved in cell wall biosynthesis
MKPVINIFWPISVGAERNRGIYQRLWCLAHHFPVRIFLFRGASLAPELAEKMEVVYFPFKLGKFQRLFYSLWVLRFFLKKVGNKTPQIAYSINHRQYLLGFALKKLFGAKWVIDGFHSPYRRIHLTAGVRHYHHWLYDNLLLFLLRRILPQVDAALAMSHAADDGFGLVFQREFGVHRNKVHAIPDGVDLAYSRAAAGPGWASRNADRGPRLIHVGSIMAYKFLFALPLLAQLKEKYPGLALTILGDMEDVVQSEVRSWLAQNRHWVERRRVDHTAALREIAQADVGLCVLDGRVLDYRLSHPVKVFEYMALGAAVLAPDFEGLRGMVRHGETGLLYKDGDAQDFLSKLRYLLDHPQERRRLAANAAADVARFDWPELNKQVVQVFDHLA